MSIMGLKRKQNNRYFVIGVVYIATIISQGRSTIINTIKVS